MIRMCLCGLRANGPAATLYYKRLRHLPGPDILVRNTIQLVLGLGLVGNVDRDLDYVRT